MADTFAEWVILELLGHRRLAGYLTEQEIAGASFLRLDIPGDSTPEDGDGDLEIGMRGGFVGGTTQFYSPSSVYAITPTSEEIARAAARGSRPAPVQRWELEPATPRVEHVPPPLKDGPAEDAWGPVDDPDRAEADRG